MRKLLLLTLASTLLGAGVASAQSVETTVTDSPNGRVVRHITKRGPFSHTETDVYGRYGRRCHISSDAVNTPFGREGRSRKRCN